MNFLAAFWNVFWNGSDQLWISILLFAFGLFLLIKGGDWFVDGSVGLARRFHLPELIIGATIVSIGTTLPEVMVSTTAALKGMGDTAYGNAIGSIICNTALISGLTIAVMPSSVDRKTLRLPVAFFFLSAVFYTFVTYFFGRFDRWSGIVLLCLFVLYMVSVLLTSREAPLASPEEPQETSQEEAPLWKDLLGLILGAACIAIGANLLVTNGTNIATGLGVPESVVALTFVALGTSLPELTTAITSLIKGHSSLSLGNIIGANLFNLVLVSGISITVNPFAVPTQKTLAGINGALIVDVPLMLIVMLLMTLPALFKQRLSRKTGVALLFIYAAFCAYQFFL